MFYLFCYLYLGFFWERICQLDFTANEDRGICKCFFNVLLWPISFSYSILIYIIGKLKCQNIE